MGDEVTVDFEAASCTWLLTFVKRKNAAVRHSSGSKNFLILINFKGSENTSTYIN